MKFTKPARARDGLTGWWITDFTDQTDLAPLLRADLCVVACGAPDGALKMSNHGHLSLFEPHRLRYALEQDTRALAQGREMKEHRDGRHDTAK